MEKEKYVDESWKQETENEKEKLSKGDSDSSKESKEEKGETCSCGVKHDDKEPHISDIEVNFLNYITSLGYQIMIFLGEISSPVTNAVEKSLDQAKFLIDTLIMLREKTKGNLNEQENGFLNSTICELELKYVENIEKEKKDGRL